MQLLCKYSFPYLQSGDGIKVGTQLSQPFLLACSKSALRTRVDVNSSL